LRQFLAHFELTYFPVTYDAISVSIHRCEMKNPTFPSELHKRVGAPSSETVQSLRLLKAFVRLGPRQRFEVIELVERLANDELPSDQPLS
jgi:hypothetical protein